jgi:hypothetical protein
MKHLKISKHFGSLNPGEIAGFDDESAEALVKSGLAEYSDFRMPKKAKEGKVGDMKPLAQIEEERLAAEKAELDAAEEAAKLQADEAAKLAEQEAAAKAGKGK